MAATYSRGDIQRGVRSNHRTAVIKEDVRKTHYVHSKRGGKTNGAQAAMSIETTQGRHYTEI